MINHNFKKKFGQNFISDTNLITAIINDSNITKDDEILEIGAGGGSLTQELSKNAKKVISYEIDTELKDHLYSLDLENVTFKFGDVMKYDISEIEKDFKGNYKMVANLPYYITTPLLFKFLTNSKNLTSLTIMVQKEVAERIVASAGGKDYGVLSVMVQFYGDVKITRYVNKKMFFPQPQVDSAVVKIDVKNKYPNIDDKKFYRFIQACFSMRRKTLKNNLLHSFPINKEIFDKIEQNYSLTNRAESFNMEDFINLFNIVKAFI